MGGDKKPSFEYFQSGHGKTVLAEATLTEDAVRRVLRTKLPTSPTSPGRAPTARSPPGCSRWRSRPRRRSPPSSRRPARTSGWSGRARWRTARRGSSRAGCRFVPACPASRSRPSAAARRCPSRARWLEVMGCAGAGKVYRFAQIVAAATLALEISASAAMATAGSGEFFSAHHERGGLRSPEASPANNAHARKTRALTSSLC